MRVSIILKDDTKVTGLRRYSDSLVQYLNTQAIDVQLAYPNVPVPQVGLDVGRKLGWDVRAFLENYPVSARPGPASVYHLASENLASLLMFKRLEPAIVTVHAFFTYLLRNNAALAMYNHVVHEWFDSLAAKGLHRADMLIAVSQYVKDSMVEHLGIASNKIVVVPEAVDHTIFRPMDVPADFYARHGLNPAEKIVLYVGSEQPRKNLQTLIRAFARVEKQVGGIRLVKVGQPEVQSERQKALDLIAKLGIQDKVTFCSHAGAELPLFYNAASVFVFPSLFEGFGFPPLEAMACGTPVLCSNTTSLPEVVGNAAGLFAPMDEDTLVELLGSVLTSQEQQRCYRQRGLENASRFSWAETARQTVDVYRRVAA